MGQPHEVLWSGMAFPALGVPEVTANNPVPEVRYEMGQPHEVLWIGMACSALGVPEVTAYRCNLPNSDSLRVINPNRLDSPLTSEITNGLDPPHQESNKDGCPSIMVYWDYLKYDICRGAGRRNNKDMDWTPSKILNSNALDPPITAHILNGLNPPEQEPLAMHCIRA